MGLILSGSRASRARSSACNKNPIARSRWPHWGGDGAAGAYGLTSSAEAS